MNADHERTPLEQLQAYQTAVAAYESIDQAIDTFLNVNGGSVEHLSADKLTQYRELSRKREDLQNEIRILGQQLDLDES
jgi:hypothetical protein